MKILIACLLRTGLVVSSLAAIVMAVRIILNTALGFGMWYWGGALAAFSGPVAFALTIYLLRAAPPSASEENDA